MVTVCNELFTSNNRPSGPNGNATFAKRRTFLGDKSGHLERNCSFSKSLILITGSRYVNHTRFFWERDFFESAPFKLIARVLSNYRAQRPDPTKGTCFGSAEGNHCFACRNPHYRHCCVLPQLFRYIS